MTLLYKLTAVKQLKNLSALEQKKILKKIVALSQNPLAGKKLKGEFRGLYSLRSWPYRIIYEMHEHEIIILTIGHRKDVYK